MSSNYDLFDTLQTDDWGSKILIDKTTLIPKNTEDKFLKLLQKAYDGYQNANGDDRLRKMLITMLNCVYTQKRPIIGFTRHQLRRVGKQDFNWKSFAFENSIYKSFFAYLEKTKFFKILKHGSNTPGNESRVTLVELIDPNLLALLPKFDMEKCRKEADLFWQQTVADRLSDRESDTAVRQEEVSQLAVRTKKLTTPTPSSRKIKEGREEGKFKAGTESENPDLISSLIVSSQIPEAPVKFTRESDRFFRIAEPHLNLENLEHVKKRVVKQAFNKLGSQLRLRQKDSADIKTKLCGVLDLIYSYGPDTITKQSVAALIKQRHEEVGPTFDKAARSFLDTLDALYFEYESNYRKQP